MSDTSTKPNAELAWRVIDQIDAHPETWDQGSWQCGTSACFAGWAVRLSGGVIENDAAEPWKANVLDGLGELNGRTVYWAARQLLGMNLLEDAYEDLTSFDNRRGYLGSVVQGIFGPRPGGAG